MPLHEAKYTNILLCSMLITLQTEEISLFGPVRANLYDFSGHIIEVQDKILVKAVT